MSVTTTVSYAPERKSHSLSSLLAPDDLAAGHILLTATRPAHQPHTPLKPHHNPSSQRQTSQSCQPSQQARSVRPSQSNLPPWLIVAWDCAWKAHYRFTATFGLSVMEPWERAFTLLLFVSLIVLFVLVAIQVPALTAFVVGRVSDYIPNISSATADTAGKVIQGNATGVTSLASDLPIVDVQLCQSVMQMLAAESNASFPLGARQARPFLTPFTHS
ncbi:Small subunit of serine palmitoyltransferase-like protein [Kalmanozyma brasiliensis GHG001]|uniref:Small subunit of serine palmitoyltransferase-like protein n=1 Tax=Kalmanozyma brasiliensis (strain GHG001) TaxID=1365824 RepID=UPI00286818E2|nr:Small subunit of serine palmitoyltransferase-like protein [Kalmanozyma brasiliensis GHG001]KAF6767232.1 Small subunit of serine palmitoyltransferase-like protein [Kalmanozyma brasiliensis GHG001]